MNLFKNWKDRSKALGDLHTKKSLQDEDFLTSLLGTRAFWGERHFAGFYQNQLHQET